ncbi:ubiquinone biosynthesis O-methyltransferase, mitochondrial isoform X1 [Ahaetulla prasina]|uniref:ubiquinone biosynthesis O-methyltransferase, mitochondrial isoform X1 n=1 Tax=Ahaetulla prasina TaxID=499056 RepID=UPI0026494B56|nr:ubiquinone biosynthesis O-methyltransferase, mitochondrial isoform X1 [Ahaetulla prasina]
MEGWARSSLWGTRRLWAPHAHMTRSRVVCGRPLNLWASSGNRRSQLHQIFQESFCIKVQLNYGKLVNLTKVINKIKFTGQPYSTSQTVDPGELRKFQRLAQKWWNEDGEYAALHSMNDIRVPFIRDTILNLRNDHELGSPLFSMKILDVGCGGGLLTEPLARLGASVTGIDPLEENIRTAELHKSYDPALTKRIQYRACTLEDIVEEGSEKFDIVVASEVVEHVADVEKFIKCFGEVLKPEGSLFITTLNKTQLSYVFGIIVAEKLLGIVPVGTHDWEKFISPEELERLLESNGFSVKVVKGMLYNPLFGSWSWTGNTSINYALHAIKSSMQEQLDLKEPSTENQQAEANFRTAS